MYNPPETCKRRVFEPDTRLFCVEPALCVYHCKDVNCTVHIKFMEGSKIRKKFAGVEEPETVQPVVKAPTPTPTKINRRRR